MMLGTLPTDRTPRPTAPAPLVENIPAELKERNQWVVWRYELRKDKWTKPLYIPGTTRNASHSKPSTWRSFADALSCYRERPDYFDGIGYVFSENDPYVGGDQDHDLSTERIPATYAEISPSGGGVKFIGRASGDYGRKTARGELYSSKRFFTITGHVLPGHEQITECQAAVEAFAASLGGNANHGSPRDGTPGAGNRAQIAADIPESEWEAGRQIRRDKAATDQLCRRVLAAAGEGTQLALLLSEQYAEFERRWPFVGIYRKDGTLDDSQVRAVAARGIKGRGFTFAEFVAEMSRRYAATALKKWGTKEAWRQEMATLWHISPGPRFEWRPRPAPTKRDVIKRGRGRPTHAPEVERFYLYLRERITSAAPITIGTLAADYGIHRRTISTYLAELRTMERISWQRSGRYGGLAITFLDVIENQPPVEAVSPQPSAPNDLPTVAALEETEYQSCVSSDRAEADHSLPTLADAVTEAFDAYADRPFVTPKPRKPRPEPVPDSDADKRRRIRRKSRGARRAPITRPMVAHYVAANFPGLSYSDDALTDAIAAERHRRKLAALPTMAIGALKAEIRLAEHLADKSREDGDRAWCWWLFYRDAARAELAKRPAEPGRAVQQVCEALLTPSEVVEQFPHRRRERLAIYQPGVPLKRLPLASLPDATRTEPHADHAAPDSAGSS